MNGLTYSEDILACQSLEVSFLALCLLCKGIKEFMQQDSKALGERLKEIDSSFGIVNNNLGMQ